MKTIHTANQLEAHIRDLPDALAIACDLASAFRLAWLARRDLAMALNAKNEKAFEESVDRVLEIEKKIDIRWRGEDF